MSCDNTLKILVRHRPYSENGIIATFGDKFRSAQGWDYYALTKMRLDTKYKDEPKAGSPGDSVCVLSLTPTLDTDLTRLGDPKSIMRKTLTVPYDWNNIPTRVELGVNCAAAGQRIQDQINKARTQ